jgi:ATP-dependent DNA ligase|nr:MAG TPA: Thermostable DNA ligase [Bacteriophage sp.]
MSIQISNTIAELQTKCEDFGIRLDESVKHKKDDYVKALRKEYLKQRYEDSVPEYMNMVLSFNSVMLAGRIDKFKDDLQQEVWDNEEWEFEEKVDGFRCLLISDGKNPLQVFSRFNSKNDLLPINITERIFKEEVYCEDSFILDCELVSSNGSLVLDFKKFGFTAFSSAEVIEFCFKAQKSFYDVVERNINFDFKFVVFDCLYKDGFIMDKPLCERRKEYERVINRIKDKVRVEKVFINVGDKKAFLSYVVNKGGEGVVAKNITSQYTGDSTRNKTGWIKIKTKKAENNIDGVRFGDTVDAFISGCEFGSFDGEGNNFISAVRVSAYGDYDDIYDLGTFDNINIQIREGMTNIVNGIATMNPDYYGKVVELEETEEKGKYKFIRFRHDKNPYDCKV